MKIEILGTGCKSCDTLYQNTANAIEKSGLGEQVNLSKTDDIDYFAKVGLFTTPGLVVDGELISSGKVMDEDQIMGLLKTRTAG